MPGRATGRQGLGPQRPGLPYRSSVIARCPLWSGSLLLCLRSSTYSIHFHTTTPSLCCQPRQAALMDCLHYLPHHCLNIYQTIMYLVFRSGRGRGRRQHSAGQMQGLITDGINPPDLKIKSTSRVGRVKGNRYLHVRKRGATSPGFRVFRACLA